MEQAEEVGLRDLARARHGLAREHARRGKEPLMSTRCLPENTTRGTTARRNGLQSSLEMVGPDDGRRRFAGDGAICRCSRSVLREGAAWLAASRDRSVAGTRR